MSNAGMGATADAGADRQRHRRLPHVAPVQEPAALHHVRQRRRRQEHPDRAPAVRDAPRVRGPPRRARDRLGEGRHAGRRPRLRTAARRAVGRARAGHHDRRRLPLLRHRAPQVHRGRHAGPRAVHPQHGDGCVDRRRGDHPGRCPQGRAHPDPSPQLSGVAAGHQAGGRRHQQDGPDGLLPRGVLGDRGGVPRLRCPDRAGGHHVHPAVGAEGRQHRRAQRATRRGITARRCSGSSRRCRSTTTSRSRASGCRCSG